jgi:hypothetical protein
MISRTITIYGSTMKTNPSSHLAFIFCAVALLTFVSCSLVFMSCRKSNPVTPGTPAEPDSTSHDFVWEEISIGDDHSVLHDVYALNDTDVWAVGAFTTRKQNGDLMKHNALHWDGKTWTVIDVPIPLPGTSSHYPSEILSVIAFSHNDVWFEGGSSIVFWNGKKFYEDTQISGWFPLGVYKMWGKNRNDVYLVGGKGAIGHYRSGGFFKLKSGTTFDINDIWGVGDTAYCIASNWFGDYSESFIYRLVDGRVEPAYEAGLDKAMKSLWFCAGMQRLTAVGGFYEEWNGKAWQRSTPPLHWYHMGIRGNSPNDYFVVDQRGGIAHFNGKSWKKYTEGISNDLYFLAIACTPENVWAVSQNDIGRLVIVHGIRK